MRIIDDSVQIFGCEARYAIQEENVFKFNDIRRRIRIGMGHDQGAFSIPKLEAIYSDETNAPTGVSREKSKEFLQERWKGIYFSLQYGDQLPTAHLMQSIFVGVGGYDVYKNC